MSDKAEKKKEEPAAEHGEKKKGGIGALLTKLPVLLGGVMFIEAVVLFAGMKMLMPSPQAAIADVDLAAHGADAETPADDGHGGGHGEAKSDGHGGTEAPAVKKIDPKKPMELTVVAFKAPNSLSGRTFMYDVEICVVVKGANHAKVKLAVEERGSLLKDRIRTIIGQSDPKKLGGGSEPGLETLRRQVKYQLDEIIGEGLVDEVLVPRCIPFRTDF